MPDVCKVAPDLMFASRQDLHRKLRDRNMAPKPTGPEPLQDFELRDALFPPSPRLRGLQDSLPHPGTDLTTRGRDPSVAEHSVLASDLSGVELHLEIVPGFIRLSQQNQSRAWHIQAMQEAVIVFGIFENGLHTQSGPDKICKLKLCVPTVNFPVRGLVHHNVVDRMLPQ